MVPLVDTAVGAQYFETLEADLILEEYIVVPQVVVVAHIVDVKKHGVDTLVGVAAKAVVHIVELAGRRYIVGDGLMPMLEPEGSLWKYSMVCTG